MEKDKLTWRSFVDQGEISEKWNVPGTPTYYVIDHNGVIRHKWFGHPGEKAIDSALERLFSDAVRSGKKSPK